jgi:hypothetical protein
VSSGEDDGESEEVARASFLLEKTDGTSTVLTVVIGKPYIVDESEARCPVKLEGLYDRVADISGVGTLQALSLALDLAWRCLTAQLDQGHLLFDDDGEPATESSIAAAFGRAPSPREGAG